MASASARRMGAHLIRSSRYAARVASSAVAPWAYPNGWPPPVHSPNHARGAADRWGWASHRDAHAYRAGCRPASHCRRRRAGICSGVRAGLPQWHRHGAPADVVQSEGHPLVRRVAKPASFETLHSHQMDRRWRCRDTTTPSGATTSWLLICLAARVPIWRMAQA